MKIDLIWIGKTAEDYVQSGINDFSKRLSRYTQFSIREIKAIKKKVSEKELIRLEQDEFLKIISEYDAVYLLDEVGKEYSSVEFASVVDRHLQQATRSMCFVIGGAYGFGDEVRRSGKLISLSRMTFSHQLVRVLFLEQLYRAFTILNNEPYHHS